MIEKFSPEELAIIKRELGIFDEVSLKKKDVLAVQKQRIKEEFPLMLHSKKHYHPHDYVKPAEDIEKSLFMICDHIHKNYNDSPPRKHRSGYARSSEVLCNVENYKADFDAILNLIIELKEKRKGR